MKPKESPQQAPRPWALSGSEQVELEVVLLSTAEEADSPGLRRGDRKAPVVLVVDDDADMRRYVGQCLSYVGIEADAVVEADSAERAIATLRAHGADLVITDIVLPRADGLALVRAMRSEPRFCETPVLVITGEASQRDAQERVHGAGAHAVLIKPFNARSFGQAVERLLGPHPSPTTGQ